ncbi:MAG: CAP domain-containing protein [Candidatus Gracilibacteria bacterium]|nr:CAP domain-containing protein [Candidatus Gracilibacteria bacterium]
MKKIFIIICILFFVTNNSYAQEYQIDSKDQLLINKITSKFQEIIKKGNNNTKKDLEYQILEYQNDYKQNQKIYNIFQEVIKILYPEKKENKDVIEAINSIDNYIEKLKSNNIDYNKVKNIWLSLHNETRNNLGLNSYSYNEKLNYSSFKWSETQNQRGDMSHKRELNDSYYDYSKIKNWLTNNNVNCILSGGVTFSESIGKFGYYCYDDDCSDELIDGLKQIYKIYENEKGLNYPENAHYLAIVNPYYTKIGLGISIKKTSEKNYYDFYVTTHYCSNLK